MMLVREVVVCRAGLMRERGGPALYRRAWCRRRRSARGSRGGSFRSGRRRVASFVVGRFDHDRVEPGRTNELAGASEAACVADLGEQVAGEDRPDTPDRLQGAQASVGAGELAQLAVELGDFLLERGDQTQQ